MSILNWKNKVLGFTAQMGGGGSSGGSGGTTQQANQYSGISPWAQPYVGSLLGAAQQQVFQTKATPGTAGHYVDAQGNTIPDSVATNWQAPTSTTGAHLDMTSGRYVDANGNPADAPPSNPYSYVAATPGTTEITGINPYHAYGSIDPTTGQQYGMTASDQAAAQASVAGFTPLQQQAYQGAANLQTPGQFGQATGAAQQGIGQALSAGQNYQQTATNPYATAAYMNPYLQQSLAPQLQLLAQQTGIQGAQQQSAATQAGAFGGSRSALQNALVQQSGNLASQNAIAQGYNTAFNQAQQAQQFGANLGLQGSQAGISGATALGNLGTGQLSAQQGILGLQNTYGGQQQQQQQNIINAGMTNYQTAQQYPMTQLQQLSGLAAPYVTKDVTTTQQQAQPAVATQLAGLGTAGVAGLALAAKAKGGVIKGYAGGGIAALNRKALLSPETISPQALQRSTQDGAIAPQVSGIAKAIQLNEQVNGKNAAAMNQPAPQGTIMDELEAKAGQMDQAEMLPKAIAVLKHKMDQAVQEGDIPLAKKYAAELEQLTQMAKGPEQAPSAPAPEGIQQIAPQAGQMAQTEQPQGIDAAPSNLPTQAMAKGGIASFAEGGGIEAEGSYLMHPDVQRLVANGEISPGDARWMSDYAFTKGDTRVETSTSDNMKDMSQRMQNYVNRMEKGEVPIPKHMAHEVKVGGNLSGLNPRGGGGVGSGGGGSAEIKILQNPRAMKDGGIASFASRGYVDEDEYQTKEQAEDEELQQLFGTGSDNDFVQAVAARGKQSEMHPSAGITVLSEPVKASGKGHKYEADVIKEAKRIGLPENIALHALYKETGGLKDPESARSKAGAIGIMQLMPATAKELGVNPHDPIENIQGGVGYLKKMYDKYQDPRLTLMAYNAGPGRVDKALKSREGLSSLPLETRNYKAGGIAHYDGTDGSLVEDLAPADVAETTRKSGSQYLSKMFDQSNAQDDYIRSLMKPGYNYVNPKGFNNAAAEADDRSFGILSPVVAASNKNEANPVQDKIQEAKKEFNEKNVNITSPLSTTETKDNIQSAPMTSSEKLNEFIMQDIMSRKEESKKTREQNNLLALMQAGLGMAASKNISPLGAIGEGGTQGVGALAQYRKEEGQEARDIAAQQLGLYKYKAAQEASAATRADTAEYRKAQLGNALTDQEKLQMKVDSSLQHDPQVISINNYIKSNNISPDTSPAEWKWAQEQLEKIRQKRYADAGIKTVPSPVQLDPFPTKPAKKPWYDFSSTPSTPEAPKVPPLPSGYQEIKQP